ncbi:palmitoyl-protein thioesterase [Flagelloscypha sp. PMI_526]|nr:palmitoyl-protein thioesterase [Flagelloscypha sp. PMI_526]
MLLVVSCLFLLVSYVIGTPVSPKLRPLVVWHGLGDSYASPGMLEFAELLKEQHPGLFVHLIYVDEDNDKDKEAGFYGYVNDQISLVAEQLAAIPELKDGFDAIGFSQGGQFLRGYVQMYNTPPIRNLITFGSQHMGVSDIPACRAWDLLCKAARRLAKNAIYGEWAQTNIVQAQYYRDPEHYSEYLEASQFLAQLNNEHPDRRNSTYAKNFASLENLVLAIFTEDETVIPKESSWFGAEAIEEGDHFSQSRNGQSPLVTAPLERQIIPMRLQPLYQEDWVGLRSLDEAGKVFFETCEGPHMAISGCWKQISAKYVGTPI